MKSKLIKFTEEELKIIGTLNVYDVCHNGCFDETKRYESYECCNHCWVSKAIDSILKKIGE